nr:sortase B protein-sorting domain-containing protein [Oscillospiraceae bacterium]
ACWPILKNSDGTFEIYIGGQKISHDYYSIDNENTTLWIYRNLLDQLRSNSTYTLTVKLWHYVDPSDYSKGIVTQTASTQFNVLAAGSTSVKSPKTGDNANIGLWAAVLVVSGAAVVALIPKKKKGSR